MNTKEGIYRNRPSTILPNGALAYWVAIAVVAVSVLSSPAAYAQVGSTQREALTEQLEALEREAAALDQKILSTQAETRTLQREVALLDSEIKRRELEIRRLTLAVRQAEFDIQAKITAIDVLSRRIIRNRAVLSRNIQKLYDYDREQIVMVLAKNDTLSDFFSTFDNIRTVQTEVQSLVGELRETREAFEREKAELEEFREEQLSLKALAEVERRAVAVKRLEKDQLLKLTKGREAEFQKLLAQKKKDIAALRTQLFYLERTGITAEDALKFAGLAAERSGIRTAFLLALLEVETGRQFEGGVISAGTHLGTGNWRDDMYNCYISLGRRSAAENQKNAFFKITSQLGLDPDKMPVSRRPSYGCGGAMGPAQFIPTTWLLFEDKVAALTGHTPPNPWNVEDAFTASAVFLSEAGARSKTRAGEIAAARTYISGRPNCPASGAARSACLAYANRVVSLAADIEKVI